MATTKRTVRMTRRIIAPTLPPPREQSTHSPGALTILDREMQHEHLKTMNTDSRTNYH